LCWIPDIIIRQRNTVLLLALVMESEPLGPMGPLGGQLTAEQVFKFFDKDGSGSIDSNELATGLRAMGCNPTDSEIQDIIKHTDSKVNPNGRIEFVEFCRLVQTHGRTKDDERGTLIKAFKIFDKNGDGILDKNELRMALTTLGFSKLSSEEVDELFAEADKDGSGGIDLNELVRVMMA